MEKTYEQKVADMCKELELAIIENDKLDEKAIELEKKKIASRKRLQKAKELIFNHKQNNARIHNEIMVEDN